MERMLETLDLTIPAGRTLRIHDARGTTLRVTEGCAWITEDANPDDYVLEAGDARRVAGNGLTLVHAFKAVRMCVEGRRAAAPTTFELGSGYNEYAAAVFMVGLRDALRRFARRIQSAGAALFA